ncbi:MAG TPA: alpha/beta hydrolase-fold protein [Acidimicrobiales bacterium]|nr:alpha/beta hydrolase-fold protein [Acidimicrobiales bacterium]
MRRRALVLAAAAVSALALPACPRARASASEITVVSDTTVAGYGTRLHRIVLQTPALPGGGNRTEIQVLLPPDYSSSSSRRYPVLYLLHGSGDTDRSWADPHHGDLAGIEAKVGFADAVVVMPDGGNSSGRPREAGWYTDWLRSDDQYGPPQWETYLTQQLVPWVDSTYATKTDRSERVVAGLSMGGYGAMALAARHPGLFGIAASFSGAVDIADGGLPEAQAFNQLHSADGTPDANIWGDYAADEVNWRGHNPPDLVSNLDHTVLYARSGTGVVNPANGDSPQDAPLEAGVASMNTLFFADLQRAGIPCDCAFTPTGTHSWPYWRADLTDFLTKLPGWLGSKAASSPRSFDYRSTGARFSAYGWSFSADPRRADEFLAATGVTSRGLSLTGSGLTTVVTPPGLFSAGETVRVTGAGPAGTASATAGSDGSLTFRVDLGPPHPNQEFTPQGDAAGDRLPGYFVTADVGLRRAH